MCVDVGFDGGGNEVAQRETLTHTTAQVGGGVVDRRYVQPYQAVCQKRQRRDEFCRINALVQPWHHCQRCLGEDTLRIVPGGQVVERIFAHQKEPFSGIWVLRAQQCQHIHGVMGAWTVQIHTGERKGGVIGDGSSGHRGAVCGGRERPVAFVRRFAGRHEEHAVKAQLRARRLCQREVSVMQRIEGAAEDAETRLVIYSLLHKVDV